MDELSQLLLSAEKHYENMRRERRSVRSRALGSWGVKVGNPFVRESRDFVAVSSEFLGISRKNPAKTLSSMGHDLESCLYEIDSNSRNYFDGVTVSSSYEIMRNAPVAVEPMRSILKTIGAQPKRMAPEPNPVKDSSDFPLRPGMRLIYHDCPILDKLQAKSSPAMAKLLGKVS